MMVAIDIPSKFIRISKQDKEIRAFIYNGDIFLIDVGYDVTVCNNNVMSIYFLFLWTTWLTRVAWLFRRLLDLRSRN